MEYVDVTIVGAGQAGLSLSHELKRHGVDHVVLERGRVGETWRRRWDSFCLVTPNWTVQLPGYPYDGDQPDGFMTRDEIVAYLERYARRIEAPVQEGVAVASIQGRDSGGFVLSTSSGTITTATLVLANGAYQRPHRIAADTLPPGLLQLDVGQYRNPGQLPDGKILLIGSGESGVQLAEELHEAGRQVVLACGKAPWTPRRIDGHDVLWWFIEAGIAEQPVSALPSPMMKLTANPLATGRDGGHDLHLRTLQAMGVTLTGRFLGVVGGEARFAPDLAESVAWGDARYLELREAVRMLAAERGLGPPQMDDPAPFDARAPERIDLSDFGAVIFTAGFRPDYRSWLPWPEAFDDLGFPLQRDGESTVVPGFYFIGVHYLRKLKSAFLFGVGEDAEVVGSRIAQRHRRKASHKTS
jgi:putative flavoprotein involved in K+ transport